MKQSYSINHLWHIGFRVMLCICGLHGVCTSCSMEENGPTDVIPLSFSCDAIDETRAFSRAEAYNGNDFGVYAKLYQPEYASETTGRKFMTNERVTYNVTPNGTTYCATEKDYYWAMGDTHFAAYSPYAENPADESLKVTVPETPYTGYRYTGTVDGHTDYMFSNEQLGGYEDFAAGTVPIHFHHALTKVEFFVKLSKAQDRETTWSFDINSLQLVNLYNQGNVSFTHQEGAAVNTWVSDNTDNVWNLNSSDRCEMAVIDKVMEVNDTQEHQIGETLYLMPQLLENANESGCQSLILQYAQNITNGDETKIISNPPVTIPLCTSSIAKWGINNYVKYVLLLEPSGFMELVAEVQPWDLVETTNEFSTVVSVLESDRISWTQGSHNDNDNNPNNKSQIILWDDRSKPAEFSFKISHPLGSTWHAIFRTISGATDAFELRDLDGNIKTDGAVGEEVTLRVHAKRDNTTSVSNVAELMFVVRSNGQILPVDIITRLGGGKNYEIVQNINK